jgi:CRP/FNR family transcriptional regulator, cyclic AMP receptor protein
MYRQATPTMPPGYGDEAKLAGLLGELFCRGVPLKLRPGETLVRFGDQFEGCYILDEGLLKIGVSSPVGDERIVYLISKGGIIGEIELIALPETGSIAAFGSCELRYVARDCLDEFSRSQPQIYKLLATSVASRLRHITVEVAAQSARARMANALLSLAELVGKEEAGGEVTLPIEIHQKELAAMAGIARENACRILKAWEDSQLLVRSHYQYRIRDKRRLERESSS